MPISEVYNCDCLEYMRSLPDKYFDLTIADPPYGIGEKFKGGRTGALQFNEIVNKDWDHIPQKLVFEEMKRISKHQVIWGGNYFDLPPTRCFLIWDKKIPETFSLSMIEYAWTSFDSRAKMFSCASDKGDSRIHPTQKPIALYSWILDNYAMGGGKIFDPFLGSGSSRIAAYKKGYDFYACELDKDYYDAQEERFRKECFGEIRQDNGQIITNLSLF